MAERVAIMGKLQIYKIVLLVLIGASAFAMFEIDVVRWAGRAGIMTLFAFSFISFFDLFVINENRFRHVILVPIVVVSIMLLYLVRFAYDVDFAAGKFVFTVLGTFFCIFSLAKIYAEIGISRTDLMAGFVMLALLMAIGFLDWAGNDYIKFNLLSKMIFAVCYFPLFFAESRNKSYPVTLILLLVSGVYTGSKIVVLLWLVLSSVWVFGRRRFVVGLLRPSVFYISFFSVIALYMYFSSAEMAPVVNSVTHKYLGGNFFTNRENIWPAVFEYAWENCLWFGCGFDINMAPIIGKDMSAHNSFLEVFVQGGAVLALLVIIFFHFMFPRWCRGMVVPRLYWCSFVIVATSETILFQSKTGLMLLFVPALAHWGSGIYFSRNGSRSGSGRNSESRLVGGGL